MHSTKDKDIDFNSMTQATYDNNSTYSFILTTLYWKWYFCDNSGRSSSSVIFFSSNAPSLSCLFAKLRVNENDHIHSTTKQNHHDYKFNVLFFFKTISYYIYPMCFYLYIFGSFKGCLKVS